MSFTALLVQADRLTLSTLGESVTYSPSEGAAVLVTGIFDEAYVLVDGGQAGVSSAGPAVFLLLADLPSDPADDEAVITRASIDYSVREAKPDGQGGILLLLHKA